METLYDRLEVSEKASKEVIEKAYRVLAKKYHPDLQAPKDRQKAEVAMKQINEAYEVLSNDQKRQEYDAELARQKEQAIQEQVRQAQQTKQTVNENTAYYEYRELQRIKYEQELKEQQERLKQQMENEYQNAYYNYLRRLGYRIKENWTWQKTKRLLIILSILISILVVLWYIPPTHKLMLNIYESNIIIKIIVNIFIAIFKAIIITIKSVFTGVFNKP